MGNKIIDINSKPLGIALVLDDKYDNLQQVLLDGKTISKVTDQQLLYMINVDADKLQVEMQALIQEYMARVTGVKPMVTEDENG